MSKFYTNVDRFGEKIFHRFVDNGVPQIEIHDYYKYEMYTPDEHGDCVSLLGDRLRRHELNSYKELTTLRNQQGKERVFGMEDPILQFINKEYKGEIKGDYSKAVIMRYDIETHITNKFATADTAENEIKAITYNLGKGKKFMTLTTMDVGQTSDTLVFNSEASLLERFIDVIRETQVSVLTGWNIDMFDTTYTINRIRKVLGDDFMYKLSPYYDYSDNFTKKRLVSHEYKDKENEEKGTYRIAGITSLDYLELVKKFAFLSPENYKLETIAQMILGEGKVDYGVYKDIKGLYEGNPELFIEYNKVDVELINKLEEKLMLLELAFTVAALTKCNLSDIFGTVKPWDAFIYKDSIKNNTVIPPNISGAKIPFEGGYVKPPVLGVQKDIASFDLTSLYPMIIVMFNMSPETFVATNSSMVDIESVMRLEECEGITYAHKNGLTMAANGAFFTKDQKGLYQKQLKRYLVCVKGIKK